MTEKIILAFASLLTAVNFGPILLKKFRSRSDDVLDDKTEAEAESFSVRTLKEVIEEVRQEDNRKAERLTALEIKYDTLVERMSLIEERERHMLTRAAAHEAWDRLAIEFIIAHKPDFPHPPPLIEIGHKDDSV